MENTGRDAEPLAAVKGRRRFQGFGKYYANKERNEKVDGDQLFTEEPKKLYRASGGSAKGGGRALGCPICGSRMRLVGIVVSAEGMSWDSTHGCYLWGAGPPSNGGRDNATMATGASE